MENHSDSKSNRHSDKTKKTSKTKTSQGEKASATRLMLKIAAWALLTPVLIVVLLAIALYLPPVQSWAVDKASAWISEETGMDISVGYVRLACPLDLKMEEVKAGELAEIRNIYVSVQLLPLFDGEVNIDALEMNGMKLNTDTLIAAAVVKGTLKTLTLESHGIDLTKELATLDNVKIDGADLDVWLNDSVPEDTTETEVPWKIKLQQAKIKNSDVRLRSKDMDIFAGIRELTADDAWIDLLTPEYKVGHICLKEGNVKYALDPKRPLTETPIQLAGLYADIDSVRFCPPNVRLKINKLSTPHSTLRAAIDFDLNALETENPGQMRLALEGSIGKQDMAIAQDFMPAGMLEKLPNAQLYISADVNGNAQHMNVNNLLVRLPQAVSLQADGSIDNPLDINNLTTNLNCSLDAPDIAFFGRLLDTRSLVAAGLTIPTGLPLKASMNINGGMNSLSINDLALSIPGRMDVKMNGRVLSLNDLTKLRTDVCLSVKSSNLDFLTAFISPQTLRKMGVTIPRGIGISGDVCMKGDNYNIDMLLTEGGGQVRLNGDVNIASEQYDIDAKINNIAVNHYMPSIGIGRLTTSIKAKGQGFDITGQRAKLTASGSINKINYGQYDLNGIDINAGLSNGKANALIDCNNNLLKGYADVSILLNTDKVKGTLAADIADIDFHRLGFTEKQMKFGLCSHIDFDYDFKEHIVLKGLISDLALKGEKKTFHPDDIVFDVLSRKDTTRAFLDCGDLHASIKSRGSYMKLMEKTEGLSAAIDSVISQKRLDLKELWAALPVATINFEAGEDNPLSRFITFNGLRYKRMDLTMKASPTTGLNGNVQILSMKKDSLLLDTIRLNLKSDAENCVYYGQIRNNKKNPQYTFEAVFAGRLKERGSNIGIRVKDAKGRMGLRIGLEAEVLDNGTKIRFSRETPIIGYKQFTVNKGNYVILTNDNRITADMRLKAADGTGIGIYTDDDNTEALQDITITISNLNVGEVVASIPYAPNLSGILNGDFHAIIADDEHQTLSVSSSTSVKDLTYENLKVGDISTDFVYMPDTAGTHYIDGILFMNDEEICSIVGGYNAEGKGRIDAKLTMREMPLHMINGFIPDQIIGFKGKGDGELTIVGEPEKPVVNGEIFLDSCHMYSVPYGVDMTFSNDPVRIVNSRLLLENFEMYSHNDNPLTMVGNVDFSNPSAMKMNVKMKASNFMIIDSKENTRSEAFGKAYVDISGSISGNMDNLNMMAKLDVLPSTNMSYILRDSPLTTDNHLDELVKFVNFNDSAQQKRIERPALTGFNMTVNLNIIQGAHVMCYLNADHSNYVELMGGGSLIMKYSPTTDLTMTGRYNLDGGQMKYSLPIIPLKTFEIKDGSFVEFTGDIMNPRLNITATEKIKSQVSNGNVGRSVQFECGVVITKTLQDMGLEFTLEAPEDFEIASDLNSMSADARGKLAVTMLTTGMYLADGNTNNFTMNNALSQFLQGEINNITGNALRTLDLSLGMDNTTDQAGNSHMDYSFKFSKRFFDNRLKVTIGGVVSTGNSVERGQNNSVFDNFDLEWRLNKSGSQYLNLFYNNNAYDWLDGNTEEFGGGFIWKRSMLRFLDLFKIKQENTALPTTFQTPVQKDSLANDSLTKI